MDKFEGDLVGDVANIGDEGRTLTEDSEWGELNDSSPKAARKIENMVLSFLSQLSTFGVTRPQGSSSDSDLSEGSRDRTISRPMKAKVELQLVDRTKPESCGNTFRYSSLRRIKYPRKSVNGSFRPMAQLIRVLDLAHEAVLEGLPTTKRDMYYKDVPLFRNQRTVDSLVDDVAATFQLERSDLSIRGASKGLIVGSGLTIHLHAGETITIMDTEGSLIPSAEEIQCLTIDTSISWVLVVEKEAVFQTLCRLGITRLLPRGLMITGKGYPDIATRHLLKLLGELLHARVPILGLVDGDPYGIDILSVYKFGSRALQHENSKLATDRVVWLGLRSSDLAYFNIDRDKLLPITKHDEMKALSLLQRPGGSLPVDWRKELVHMLHCRRKAEIEVLAPDSFAHECASPHVSNPDYNCFATLEAEAQHDSVSHSPLSTATLCSDMDAFSNSPFSQVFSKSLGPSHAPLLRYVMFKIAKAIGPSVEH